MLPYLDSNFGIVNSNPKIGRESSVTLPSLEMNQMAREKKDIARDNGYYTVGQVPFKLRKGTKIPAKAEEVFYHDGTKEEAVTTSDAFAKRLVAQHENGDDFEGLVTDDDEVAVDEDSETSVDEDSEVAVQGVDEVAVDEEGEQTVVKAPRKGRGK
jgi:hypothetical protein